MVYIGPTTGTYAYCGKTFTLGPIAGGAEVLQAELPGSGLHGKRGPMVSFEDRFAARIWQAPADANLVPGSCRSVSRRASHDAQATF